MATGALSSLGIGSGVLTYDVIDQLKQADEEAMVSPYDDKIKTNTEKQTELANITSTLKSMNNYAGTLSEYTTYLRRSVSVTGDSVSASVGNGFVPQDVKVSVSQLANQDIYQSGKGYASRDSSFSTYAGTLSFYHNGTNYNINVPANRSLADVAQSITDATGGAVAATIMKTGGSNPYQLTLTTKGSGAENKIYFGSTVASNGTPSGAISVASGEFGVSLKKADGTAVDIDVPFSQTDTSQSKVENGEALRDAVYQAIKDSGEFDGLLFDPNDPDTKDNPIHIDYDRESGGLIINDARGYAVSVSGSKTNSLGFTSSTSDTKENIIEGTKVASGHIAGVLKIGNHTINVDGMTSAGNTSAQNAQLLVDELNVLGYDASVGDDDNLIINTTDGSTQIGIFTPDDGSTSAAKALGLTAGTHKSEATFLSDVMQLSNIQTAQDAEFTYNGIQVSRSSNTVDDLVSGLTLTLNGVDDSGDFSTVRVTEDDEGIADDVKSFVEEYNNLLSKLSEVTKYDENLGVAGIFQGVSQIYGIKSSLNNILLATNSNNESLLDFGIYMNDDGSLEIDEEKLSSKISTDLDGTREYFMGYTSTVNGREHEFDGVFKQFQDKINGLVEGDSSTLGLYDTSLTDELDSYNESKKKAMATINARYEIMATKFAAYDTLINDMNSKFSALQSMISQANNG